MSSEEHGPQVTDHYEDPYHRGQCEFATHQAEFRGLPCNDWLALQLRLDQSGGVEEAWFEGEGCQISQAAASIVVETIEGMSSDELVDFSARKMLDLFDPPLPIDRQKCGLMAWRVLQLALASPVDDDESNGPIFGGPHLGEEN